MADDAATQREELRSRRISTEDMVRAQLDRINQLRGDVINPNRVAAWSEALEALADLLIPWASEPAEIDKFRKEWEDRPVRCLRINDKLVPFPTATDCRQAQQILMGLLDRSGLLVKRRGVSGPAPFMVEKPDEPEARAGDA